MQLAQRGLRLRLAVVAAPARQRPLRAVGAQARGAQGQQKRRSAAAVGLGERDGDRGPLQRGRRLARRQRAQTPRSSSAIFRRVASSNGRTIPLDYNTSRDR